ncbi:hypothetical protein [Thermithiobacillus plumbiphilus]|uniref:Acid-shock protein n=1 Tax=Thermithiobacillus plumbiphilus TaxID=1729899 RepID=A0ABU9DC80_9PROT
MKKSILIALSTLILASGSAFAAEHAGKTEAGKPSAAKAVHQKASHAKKISHEKTSHKQSTKAGAKG